MNKKIKRIIYYSFIILSFFIIDKLIFIIDSKDKNIVINNLLLLENNSLKEDINDLTKLNYNDYDYEIGKITYKNLYNSDSFFIESNTNFLNNIVLNEIGFIGILNNKKLTLTKDLTISVKVNDNIGILKNNKISIVTSNYNIGDTIYTSSFSNIKKDLIIGYIKNITKLSNEDILEIKYLDINTNYVVILK